MGQNLISIPSSNNNGGGVILEPVVVVGSILIGASLAYTVYLVPKIIKEKQQVEAPSTEIEHTDKNLSDIYYMFSKSEGSIKRNIIKIIDKTRHTLDVAVYSLTEKEIVQHICNAKKRGVQVRVLTDKDMSSNKFQREALKRLVHNGIQVKSNTHNGYMHLKLLISDENCLVTGSYNLSKNAETKNDEVMIFINNKEMGNEWTTIFNNMWSDHSNYQDLYPHKVKKYA
jgi:phosphatidylserine/phosphatidylglycerophosphate/cardiolipin synthase-like enzyme